MDSIPLRIVVVDPVFPFSFEDSQLRPTFYPLPAAPVFYATEGPIVPPSVSSGLETIGADELFKIGFVKPQRTAHFDEWDSSLPCPTIESGDGYAEEMRGLLNGHQANGGWCLHS